VFKYYIINDYNNVTHISILHIIFNKLTLVIKNIKYNNIYVQILFIVINYSYLSIILNINSEKTIIINLRATHSMSNMLI